MEDNKKTMCGLRKKENPHLGLTISVVFMDSTQETLLIVVGGSLDMCGLWQLCNGSRL